MESQILDLGDILDDLHLLFNEEDPSLVFVRSHSNPHVHSLHDQSLQVGMIMDTYVHQSEEVFLLVKEINGSLKQVQQTSLPNLHSFFLA